MAYQIDFFSSSNALGNADAIVFSWKDDNGVEKIGVYDGGYEKTAQEFCEHIKKYYQTKTLDFVICSHPDQDHASGLKIVLETFNVNALYVNFPWDYIDDVWDNLSDHRKTKDSLKQEMKEKFPYLASLEENIDVGKIHSAFQGDVIEDKWTILSPTREHFISKIISSGKMPLKEEVENANEKSFILEAVRKIKKWIKEQWYKDTLYDNPHVSAENEMSIVMLGELDKTILLTGDAGVEGLEIACDYAERLGIDLPNNVDIFQIPHHGGRHNLTVDIMNKMVGEILEENEVKAAKAIASTSKQNGDKQYPRRAVANAYRRRGVLVESTNGETIYWNCDYPDRDGWSSVEPLDFFNEVEPLDD